MRLEAVTTLRAIRKILFVFGDDKMSLGVVVVRNAFELLQLSLYNAQYRLLLVRMFRLFFTFWLCTLSTSTEAFVFDKRCTQGG